MPGSVAEVHRPIAGAAISVVSPKMRRRLPWLLALPLMAVGSFVAHLIGYNASPSSGAESGRELVARSSTGIAAHLVLAAGIIGAVGGLAGASWLVSFVRGRARHGASPSLFFWLPPVAFSVQEFAERLLRAEAAPFHAALEPRFLVGLALQLPFGLIALVLTRLLVRVARRIVRAFTRPPGSPLPRRVRLAPPVVSCVPPRIPALALGYPQRGPPAA